MAIRFAVLAILAERARHGYAVHALFEERLGDFLELNYGQVYQVLIALERQGLVRASEVRVGRRPWRKVYEVTPSGREALDRWLREHRVRRRPYRDDFYIRLYFAAAACPDEIERLVRDQLVRARSDLLGWRASREQMPAVARGPDLVRRLFVDAAILHAEAGVRALESAHEALRAGGGDAFDGAALAGEAPAERPHRGGVAHRAARPRRSGARGR